MNRIHWLDHKALTYADIMALEYAEEYARDRENLKKKRQQQAA